jgi:hypothetical protein
MASVLSLPWQQNPLATYKQKTQQTMRDQACIDEKIVFGKYGQTQTHKATIRQLGAEFSEVFVQSQVAMESIPSQRYSCSCRSASAASGSHSSVSGGSENLIVQSTPNMNQIPSNNLAQLDQLHSSRKVQAQH